MKHDCCMNFLRATNKARFRFGNIYVPKQHFKHNGYGLNFINSFAIIPYVKNIGVNNE